jgi:hypothetical protein
MSKNYLRRNRISEQFAPRTIRMLESPAYRVLSIHAHRVLSRIEIELAHHGGRDNGRLPVTFDQLVEYGIRRHSIAPAIRELVNLGFIEVTEQGRAGNAEWRRPNKFRLTYSYVQRAQPTNEWDRIKTDEEAIMIAKAVRRPGRNSSNGTGQKNKTPMTVLKSFQCQKRHQKPGFHSAETVTTSHSAETVTTSKLSGRRVGDGADDLAEGSDARTVRQPSCLARLRSHLLSTTGVPYWRPDQPSLASAPPRIVCHQELRRCSAQAPCEHLLEERSNEDCGYCRSAASDAISG